MGKKSKKNQKKEETKEAQSESTNVEITSTVDN
jgi:hypothetical protein